MNLFFIPSFKIMILSLCLGACDANIYQPFVKADDDLSLLEEARIRIDEQNYNSALQSLAKVKADSNDLHLLRSAARLGASGLSMWSILLDIVDGASSSSSSSSGADNFFDKISGSVVGENDIKVSRIAALTASIQDLLAAPDPKVSRVKNLACFLAGIMAIPTATDGTAAILDTTSSLASLAATVDIGNTNAECPDLSKLNSSLTLISTVQTQFKLIFDATQDCKLLDSTGSSTDFNAIEAQLSKFNQKADAGCSQTPACGSGAACQALGLGCVYSALTSGDSAAASDGVVSKCELVQNCLTPGSCF